MPGAPWSAPLPKDVLRIESLSEELDAAALGVAMAFSALLDSHTTPGWLPAVIDEHSVPLCGLMAPVPSFCFTTKDRGILPVRIVRRRTSRTIYSPPPPQTWSKARPSSSSLTRCSSSFTEPTDAPVRIAPHRAPPNDRRGAGHGICLRRTCIDHAPDNDAGELGPPDTAGCMYHRVQGILRRRRHIAAGCVPSRPLQPNPVLPFLLSEALAEARSQPAVSREPVWRAVR